MSKPIVSVIMPAYNHEKYVGEAIESVLNQTLEDFEFIIINDGSTDKTENVIKSYDDSRIRYYSQNNIDCPKTLNRGISLSKGKYISIIASDDLYHPDRLSYLFKAAEESNSIFLFTGVLTIDKNSQPFEDQTHPYIIWRRRVMEKYNSTNSLQQSFLFAQLAATTSNFFFDAKIVNDIGLFREYRYAHDQDFILRLLLKYPDKCIFLPDKKYLYYRYHDSNTAHEEPLKLRVEIFDVLVNMLPQYMQNLEDRAYVESTLERLDHIKNQLQTEVEMLRRITKPLRWLYLKYWKLRYLS